MSLFDELRIDRTPGEPVTIKAEYRVRARRQAWLYAVLIALLASGGILNHYRPEFLKPIWARVVAIAIMLVWFGLQLRNWRCPGCNMYFGKRRIKSQCPGCRVQLED